MNRAQIVARIAGAIAAAVILTTAVPSTQSGAQSAVNPIRSMPALTALFSMSARGYGKAGGFGVQRIKLVYLDRTHWRSEIVSHEGLPEVAGFWAQYDGKSIQGYDPHVEPRSRLTTRDVSKEPYVYPPLEWFSDFHIYKLEKKVREVESGKTSTDHAVVVRSEGLKTLQYTHTEQIGCPSQAEGYGGGDGGCVVTAGSTYTEEITFRANDYIPIETVSYKDGVLISRIVVEQLTFQIDGALRKWTPP